MTLQRGSRGAAVSELQARLNILGYGLAVDGVYGPATEAAVGRFQDLNLWAFTFTRGVYDDATAAKLLEMTRSYGAGASNNSGGESWLEQQLRRLGLIQAPPSLPGTVPPLPSQGFLDGLAAQFGVSTGTLMGVGAALLVAALVLRREE